MTDRTPDEAVPIPAGQVGYLIATAARAPSVHNTQPWRFKVSRYTIELHADLRRKLRVDPLGREMLISCGAAVFGLRLGVRSLGYLPLVELLPDPARLRLLARVRLGAAVPMTAREREMLEALPHRHTHRGPDPRPMAGGEPGPPRRDRHDRHACTLRHAFITAARRVRSRLSARPAHRDAV
jgi:nitroreductase